MLLASSASSGNSDFLIPNGTFIVELIIFIIVLGVVAKFILPPLQQAMDERERKIREALHESDEGHHEADRLDAERHEVLQRAHAEAREIVDNATHEVERLHHDARERGYAEFERAVAAAQAELGAERVQLQAEAMRKLESVIVAAAENIIGSDVDQAKHHELIAAAIAGAEQGVEK